MKIVVPIKLVPDLVEELEINEDGTDLDRDFLSYPLWVVSGPFDRF